MNVFNNNAKLIKENDVVLICTPKHKNKIVFGSIKSTLQSLSSSLTVIKSLLITALATYHLNNWEPTFSKAKLIVRLCRWS